MPIGPAVYRVRQRFASHRLPDPAAATRAALAGVVGMLPRAGRVAVAVGSRGIASIAEVAREVVAAIRGAGAEPIVVAAMGSHGGGTAAGQRTTLAALGITPERVGAPVAASDEVVRLGALPDGFPLVVTRLVAGAAAVVPVNRVKPHTMFDGAYGSGLVKMLLVGLGGAESARAVHAAALREPFDALARRALPALLARVPVPFGVALVEDASHALAVVDAVPATALLAREPALLQQAAAWMPALPVREVDLLIVDEMGKDVSGQGMDPLVTGRARHAPGGLQVRRLFVRGLTPASGGNAHGIGQADATTRRLVDAADWRATWVNTFASGNLARGRIPPYFDSDREAIEALLPTTGAGRPEDVRLVRIRNTLALDVAEVSAACLEAFARPEDVTVEAGPYPLAFDAAGMLAPLAG